MASCTSSSSTVTTSSDNNKEEENRSQTGLSSLESFLFLPQLPVDGDDSPFESNAHLSRHNHQTQLLYPRPLQTLLSSFRPKPSSIMGHTNHPRNPLHPVTSDSSVILCNSIDHGSISSHSCGKQDSSEVPSHSNSIAANDTDTVIATHSDSLSGVKKSHFSSSMNVLIRNGFSCNNSSGHNHTPFSLAANHPHLHQHRRRFLVVRICQGLCILLCLLFLMNLVKTFIWTSEEYKFKVIPAALPYSSQFKLQNRLIQSWNMPSILPSSSFSRFPQILSAQNSDSNDENKEDGNDDSYAHNLLLLDIPNFSFLTDNKTKCAISSESSSRDSNDNYIGVGDIEENTIFFMIIVHSAPQNLMERQAIRETWGSLQRLGQFHVRLVFLLGHDMSSNENNDDDHNYEKSSFSKILHESQKYGDIVTGNFNDSYRNLTYKHLMGYKWILSHCSNKNVKFVLKCDDDVFMDIFQLYTFLLRTFGSEPDASLICNVFPEGTKPVRRTDSQGKKWAVTYEEYPYEYYPKYCGGLAYLATPNVIREIYRMSRSTHQRYLWIDDVYVTGILRELAHVEPFYLNLRYSYDPEEYRKWLAIPLNSSGSDGVTDNSTFLQEKHASEANAIKSNRKTPSLQKIPFMIIHLERGPELQKEMRILWNKTKNVWSDSGLIS